VVADETARLRHGVESLEALDDHAPGVELVGLGDLLLGEPAHAGDVTVEVVRLGGAIARNRPAGLRPGHRPAGVRVDDATDAVAPGTVQAGMRGGVGGRVERALDDLAIEVADDEVLGLEDVVVHAARLDDEESPLPVETRGVAPGEHHETVLGEVHVRLVDLVTQFLEHHG